MIQLGTSRTGRILKKYCKIRDKIKSKFIEKISSPSFKVINQLLRRKTVFFCKKKINKKIAR